MSTIRSGLFIFNDRYVIKVFVDIQTENNYHSATIEFISNEKHIYILTSSGSIIENKIYLVKEINSVDAVIEYTEPEIECVISYFDSKKEFLSYENIKLEKYVLPEKSKTSVQPGPSVGKNFDSRLYNFIHSLKFNKSGWRLNIKVNESKILIRTIVAGQPTYAVFGEVGPSVLSSDFIIKLYPDVNTFLVPNEMVWKNYDKFSPQANIGISQLIQSDFHSTKNIYYKMLVSNAVKLENFPQPNNKDWSTKTNITTESFFK